MGVNTITDMPKREIIGNIFIPSASPDKPLSLLGKNRHEVEIEIL
jgi:hypothetical protein